MKGMLRRVALAAAFGASVAALAGIAPAKAASAAAAAKAAPRKARSIPPRRQKFFYHYEWTRGAVLTAQEWRRGAVIHDPRRHDLKPPPPGDEWREIDRNYVLASWATHAIVRVAAAPHATTPGRSGGS